MHDGDVLLLVSRVRVSGGRNLHFDPPMLATQALQIGRDVAYARERDALDECCGYGWWGDDENMYCMECNAYCGPMWIKP
jgi:hypothetical protein